MRAVLPLALALALAVPAQAQERPQTGQTERPAQVEVQQAGVRPEQPATAQGELKVSPEEARRIIFERPAPLDVAQTGPESRSWWWMVAGIVLAGVIVFLLVD